MKKQLQILGTRGVPAQHGGFETFAEYMALYLKRKGWQVTVYCQEDGSGDMYEDEWQGIHLVHIPIPWKGAKGTVVFDWKSTRYAAKRKTPVLTLGYNTAVFCALYRLKGIKNVINMDGIEWRRDKWSSFERAWLNLNEKAGAILGNHLVADHPEIKNHLARFISSKKITVIPYGADIINDADGNQLEKFGLVKDKYCILIARPEPENSILEIVKAYSRKEREMPLVLLGEYTPETNDFHKQVMDAASIEVKFVGPIYHKPVVQALRFYARLYIHGHTVGGTNPSLVEALGAGSPVLAHDNKFNRWVAGEGASYFASEDECAMNIDLLLQDDDLIDDMRKHSLQQIRLNFTLDKIHHAYESMMLDELFPSGHNSRNPKIK